MFQCLSITAALFIQISPVHFSIDPAAVEFIPFAGEEAVFIPGGASPFDMGEPSLPGINYSFVVPQGAGLSNVRVQVTETFEVPGIRMIAPVVSLPVGEPVPSVLYHSQSYREGVFPSCSVQNPETGNKTGFRIASFCFVPFQWNTDTGKLTIITEAILTPVLSDGLTDQLLLSDTQISTASKALESVVENPEMLSAYAPSSAGQRGAPWVAIADEALQETLQPLIDHRETTHGSAFVSTQWIYENYEGRDTQEQIRNYLKDAYENDGLVYALIVGDFGETTRLSSLNISGTVMDAVTDLYFCDLDGSWDLDGDSQFGELNDGLDYYSDIYTGRFSSDVPSRIATMVEKTVSYETDSPPGNWRTTALLAGAGLWVDDPPLDYWGSFVCDSIDSRIPDSWTVHKLYEDSSSHPNNQIDLYNQGVAYSSLNGHGNEGGVYWLYGPSTEIVTSANYYEMTNDGMPVVFHSMACHPGHLQNVACIAERLMFWPNGGAIAVMFNSHWGIGTPPGFGPSEWLELFFAQVLIQDEQYELGVAHGISKDEFKANVSISHQRWILQENNFLGDPATRFIAGQMGIEGQGGDVSSGPEIYSPVPNPASDQCTIAYSIHEAGTAHIAVYDISGRIASIVYSGLLPEGSGTVSADLSALPSGCYRVVVSSSGTSASAPLLVLH